MLKISKFACKTVNRKYAFEIPNIPVEADWVKLVYSYEEPAINRDTIGKTFSHLFGCNTGALENFIIKRKLMGPCWLRVSNVRVQKRNVF